MFSYFKLSCEYFVFDEPNVSILLLLLLLVVVVVVVVFPLLLFVGMIDAITEAWTTAKSEAQLPHVNHIQQSAISYTFFT